MASGRDAAGPACPHPPVNDLPRIRFTFAAGVGPGGGIPLTRVMPGRVPASAIIPVHGMGPNSGNLTRTLAGLGRRDTSPPERKRCEP